MLLYRTAALSSVDRSVDAPAAGGAKGDRPIYIKSSSAYRKTKQMAKRCTRPHWFNTTISVIRVMRLMRTSELLGPSSPSVYGSVGWDRHKHRHKQGGGGPGCTASGGKVGGSDLVGS